MRIRRKGGALGDTSEGILMVRERGNRDFSLPGGGSNRDESRRAASMRELKEETGMKPHSGFLTMLSKNLDKYIKGDYPLITFIIIK